MIDRKALSVSPLSDWPQVRLSRRSLLKSAVALTAAGTLAHVVGGISLLPGVPAVAAAGGGDNVALQWNNALLAAIRAVKPGPTIVARSLGIVHTCIYDAWAAYDKKARPTQPGTRLPKAEQTMDNRDAAISFAAYRALVNLYPTQATQFNSLMASLGYNPADTGTAGTAPSAIGNLAAKKVLDFRQQDGANQLGDRNGGSAYSDYTGYAPVNTWDNLVDPNRWQPLRVPNAQGVYVVQKCLSPHWGQVTPFGMSSGSEFRSLLAGMLKPYPDSHYEDQQRQVLDFSANLTDRQKVVAEYWADGPTTEFPPGHWNLIAQFVSARDRHDLDQDVELFFMLNCALMDSSIAAWDAKRHWDSIRPGCAIRFLYNGQPVRAWAGPGLGTRTIDGGTWAPYQQVKVNTPPFGEFVSGHSTFSRAAAEVLKEFTGSDQYGGSATIAAGSSLVEPGLVPAAPVTLRWPSFFDAADEAGMSRLYGGIHIMDGNEGGMKLGEAVGKRAYERGMDLIRGK